MWESALTRLDIAVAVVTLTGAGKSAYNGHLRRLVRSIYLLPEVKSKVEHIEDRQEKMIDGIVAVSVAESEEGMSVDTDTLAKNLREQSYRLYLERDDHSNPHSDAEDEEEATDPAADGGHRPAELGEEVDEPE